MAVVLDNHVGMLRLDALGQGSEQRRLTDTGHVLQTDLFGTGSNQLIGDIAVVFHGVNGRCGDAQRGLRRHTGGLRPFNAGYDVARVVQSAEDTGDIDTLRMFNFVLQLTHVVRHGVHAQSIQAAVKHVGLDAHFVERLAESANGMVGVFSGQEVHLLKGTTVGLYTGETSHVDDGGSDAFELVLARLEFSRRLPHVAVNKTKLDFLFHAYYVLSYKCVLQIYCFFFIQTLTRLIFFFFFCFFHKTNTHTMFFEPKKG